MHFIILGALIVFIVFGPQWWVRRTLQQYSNDRKEMPGTGGELATHLIDRFQLKDVTVHQGQPGDDFYDPDTRQISLSPNHFNGRSVAAVAVAAHEVGHALQHQEGHSGFLSRQKRIRLAMMIERFSAIALMISPVLLLITRVPQSTLLTLAIGMTGMLASVWVQWQNLPVELDASFNKAMPILAEGYLPTSDLPGARKVLKAAAYTYFAAAIASLLNLGRWIAVFRR